MYDIGNYIPIKSIVPILCEVRFYACHKKNEHVIFKDIECFIVIKLLLIPSDKLKCVKKIF